MSPRIPVSGCPSVIRTARRSGTVSIYGQDRGIVPDDPTDRRVGEHLIENLRGVLAAVQRGLYREIGPVTAFAVDDDAARVRFACAKFELAGPDGQTRASFLCVTAWKGSFVKLRYSSTPSVGAAAAFQRFAGAWSRLLTP